MPGPATDVGTTSARAPRGAPESTHAWVRLGAALALSAIGGVGMWSVIVALPAVQAEFGVARSAASLPYTHPVERAERLDRRRVSGADRRGRFPWARRGPISAW